MNEVNVLWSSPWRKLQKSLASGLGEAQGRGLAVRRPSRYPSKVVPAESWLIRARNRRAA
jgi:hypothetical protein